MVGRKWAHYLYTERELGAYFEPRRRISSGFFFSSRRRHTRLQGDWSSDVCSSDLQPTSHQPGECVPQGDKHLLQDFQGDFHYLTTRTLVIFLVMSAKAEAIWLDELKIGRASCRERV